MNKCLLFGLEMIDLELSGFKRSARYNRVKNDQLTLNLQRLSYTVI